jgi:AcrR family transcriptional regulator
MTVRASTAARRQAILDAALGLFADRGLRGTSIEDICAAAGASNGSVYHHFGSKEGIAAALYADAIADYQRGAADVFRHARSAAAGFRGCVQQYLHWVRDHRDLAWLMLAVENGDVRELAADAVRALNDQFAREVNDWMATRASAGDLPDVPRDVLLPALLGPARRYTELWLAGRAPTPIDDAAVVLADLAWDGFASRTPKRRRPSSGRARR